jgi:hypothetical protein
MYEPLPPVLTKTGKVAKRQPKIAAYQDQPALFYTTQLLHQRIRLDFDIKISNRSVM